MVSLLVFGHVVGGVEGTDDQVLLWELLAALDQVVLHPLRPDPMGPVVRTLQQTVHGACSGSG